MEKGHRIMLGIAIALIIILVLVGFKDLTGYVVSDYSIPVDGSIIYYSSMNGDSGGISSGDVNCNLVGKYDRSCIFDGKEDYIQIRNLLANKDEFTVSMWVKARVPDANRNYLMLEQDGRGKDPIIIERLANEKFRFKLYTTRVENIDSVRTFADSEWHHVVATYNGLKMRLYVDGVLEGSKSQSWSVSSALINNRLNIGSDSSDSWDGRIDEVIIWDVGLKESEVVDLYNVDSN